MSFSGSKDAGWISVLITLRDLFNSDGTGNFRCVDVNVEVGQVARDDTVQGSMGAAASLGKYLHHRASFSGLCRHGADDFVRKPEIAPLQEREVWPDALHETRFLGRKQHVGEADDGKAVLAGT